MELRDALVASPAFFPLNWDKTATAIQVARLSEEDYARASFLDHRLLESGVPAALVPWQELQAAADQMPLRCNFIFHISHAGSTLLSRLLGLHRQFFSLREPAILRWMALGDHRERLSVFLGLWSRVFRPEQTALIKATSFVSDIGCNLLELVPSSRAVLMYVPLATFLPSLLDGAMQDITSQLDSRMARLQQFLPDLSLGSSLSPGEMVALSWLTEMLSLQAILRRYPDRTLWLDFEDLLAHRQERLSEVLGFYRADADVSPLVMSGLWGRYAKRTEATYDIRLREQLIRQGEERFAEEVSRGMKWIEGLATRLSSDVLVAVQRQTG